MRSLFFCALLSCAPLISDLAQADTQLFLEGGLQAYRQEQDVNRYRAEGREHSRSEHIGAWSLAAGLEHALAPRLSLLARAEYAQDDSQETRSRLHDEHTGGTLHHAVGGDLNWRGLQLGLQWAPALSTHWSAIMDAGLGWKQVTLSQSSLQIVAGDSDSITRFAMQRHTDRQNHHGATLGLGLEAQLAASWRLRLMARQDFFESAREDRYAQLWLRHLF